MSSVKEKPHEQDAVTSVLATIELERAKKSKEGVSLRQAQRAVLMCPGSPEAWAMFLAAQVVSGRAPVRRRTYIVVTSVSY